MNTTSFVIALCVRSNSSRMPEKWSLSLGKCDTVIDFIYKRLLLKFKPQQLVFALPTCDYDANISRYIENNLKANIYYGADTDLVSRLLAVGKSYNSKYVVRYTCDDPLKDINMLEYMLQFLNCNTDFDYLTSEYPGCSGAQGLGFEIYSTDYLRSLIFSDLDDYSREHITPCVNPKNINNVYIPFSKIYPCSSKLENIEDVRVTLDTEADYSFLQYFIGNKDLHSCINVNLDDLVSAWAQHSSTKEINSISAFKTYNSMLPSTSKYHISKSYLRKFSDQALKNVSSLLDCDFRGSKVKLYSKMLEKYFASKTSSRYGLTFSNGTTTLIASLKACDVLPGDYVAVTPLTMSSPTQAIISMGAIPLYVDVSQDTLNMSPDALEIILQKYPLKIKAVLFVSLYGAHCNLIEIAKICAAYNVRLIEDNAESLFPSYLGAPYRLIGDVASYSFQTSKHLTCGDGGIIVTNDLDIFTKISYEARLGYITSNPSTNLGKKNIQQPNAARHIHVGSNYRLSEICCAVVYDQLYNSDFLMEKRIQCAMSYIGVLNNFPALRSNYKICSINEHSFWGFPIVFNHKDQLLRFMNFYNLSHDFRPYSAWRLAYDEPFANPKQNTLQLTSYYSENYTRYVEAYSQINCPVASLKRPLIVALRTNIIDIERIIEESNILYSALSYALN